VSEFEVSSSLAKAFSRLSSPYENSKSTSGYPCKLKQIFVDFLRGLNLGKFLPGCWDYFPENTAKTSSLFKMAAWTDLQCTSKHGQLRISQDICHVRMTDIEGFLTRYGHSDNLLNNNNSCAWTEVLPISQRALVEWGWGGVAISALEFRSEGPWFNAPSLPLCCFLKQETLPQIVSLHPGV